MNRLLRRVRSFVRRRFPRSSVYEGANGTAWIVGLDQRAPSIAAFFCGDDVRSGRRGRVWRDGLPSQIEKLATDGGLPILQLREPGPSIEKILHRAIAVPALVDIHTMLPPDRDELQDHLLTSTTREDFRRIRKAGFTYRVTKDPEAIREFHAQHYSPLIRTRFPDDGRPASLDSLLETLDHGGELVCADIDGEWVAGIYNVLHGSHYALRFIGIRGGDDAIRQKRVVAALIVRSLERSIELDRERATLGRSLPFLGKGPVWFKAKWGGILTRDPRIQDLLMFMDLRHESVRQMLAASPVIHTEGEELVVSAWLEPGEEPLRAAVRDAGRFPGISRWYVLGDPETLSAASGQLADNERIVPVPVTPDGGRPLWLGEVLRGGAQSVAPARPGIREANDSVPTTAEHWNE